MKKIIAYSFNLLFLVTFLASCLGDLDTMPLDNNQLVSDQVYKTKDGYTGVLAKCYSSLILTGQQGGDGGNGDLEGANEGYSGYVRLLFYLQEMSTDNFLMPSSSNGLRKCLNLQWDASNASVVTWTYQRLYMSIAYCNELLRECTEGKLQDRGLWEEMKDEYIGYRAEARFIRAYCYSMLCDLFGSVPYVDEHTGVKEIPVQYTRKQIFEYAESELLAISTAMKVVTDIERIGDHAADIAEIIPHLVTVRKEGDPAVSQAIAMGKKAHQMILDALDALTAEDENAARRVIAADDEVDYDFNAIKHQLAQEIAEDPGKVDAALDLLMVIKYLERIGDHAVNVAEWVQFMRTGRYKDESMF